MKINPSLNSLRFFCCLMVILAHWGYGLTTDPSIAKMIFLFQDGTFAVDVFFVISGFFITYGLCQYKEKGWSTGRQIRSFYIKRIFRIVPSYYLLILILLLFSWPGLYEHIFWYLTYNANHLIYRQKDWGNFSHTWSLAVEEQFYLLWPLLILCTKKEKTMIVLTILFFLSVICYFITTRHNNWSYILLPNCFFSFCAGGMLSIMALSKSPILNLKCLSAALILLLLLKIVLRVKFFDEYLLNEINNYPRPLNTMIAFLTINYFRRFPNKLDFRPTNYLGKISYGLYLYHYVITIAVFNFDSQNIVINFIYRFVILIIVSVLSYELIEKPLINFGKKLSEEI